MNKLFEAMDNETEPMYDVTVITESGLEMHKNPLCNNANNAHSVTKLFTATAIGTLYDKGLITPDTILTSVFDKSLIPDNISPEWQKVTIGHALSHKTGLENIPYGIDDDNDTPKIGNDFLGYILSLPVMHEPGTFYRYSDAAYYLLSRVITAVTGKKADDYMKEIIFDPLGFRQWAMARCPQGYPLCCGGFFVRSDDLAKLGYTYACNGVYNGRRIISEEWIDMAIENDYALTTFRDTDIHLKTGANGQMVAFSRKRKSAAAWHGYSTDNGKRNDRLLEAYTAYLDDTFGKIDK